MQTIEESAFTIDGMTLEATEPTGKQIKQGWLKKKSPKGFGGFRSWQARFFILYSNQLVYYKKETDIQPAGKVYFSQILKIVKGERFETEFRVDIICIADSAKRGREKRKFCLRAYTRAEGEDWYLRMVDVALAKDGKPGSLAVPAGGGSPGPRSSFSKLAEVRALTPRTRRATEFKPDSKLLGRIMVVEELVRGSPTLGDIYRARIGTGRRRFLLQVIPKDDEALSALYKPMFVKIQRVRCRYVMPVVGLGDTLDARWILCDYGGNHSLHRHIRRMGGIPERAARVVAAQVLFTVHRLHKEGLTCGGLCPEVIYLDGDGNVVIVDFRLAAPSAQQHIGPNEYSTPESLKNGATAYEAASDWWKLGILLYEMLLGVPPTWALSHDQKDVGQRITVIADNGLGPFPVAVSPTAQSLIRLLLGPIEQRRGLTYVSLSRHPFFKSIRFDEVRSRGRSDHDEWWEHNICSYCESTYTVYRDGEVKGRIVAPVSSQLPTNTFFDGLVPASVSDKKNLKFKTKAARLGGQDDDDEDDDLPEPPPPPPPSEPRDKTSAYARRSPPRSPMPTPGDKKSGSTTLTSIIRGVVNKSHRRFQQDGFDLDLAYITPSIIAMGFPSEVKQGVYQNSLQDVQKFISKKHSGAVKVYNLCSERPHPKGTFANQAHYPIDDHNACAFKALVDFCEDVQAWLRRPGRVVAVHCNTGKGRTGLAIAAYLTFKQICAGADEALKFYAEKRTKDMKGVSVPSQQRYVRYIEHFLKEYYWPRPRAPMFQWRRPVILQHVRLSPVPNFPKNIDGCDPYFEVLRDDHEVVYSSAAHNEPRRHDRKKDKTVEFLCDALLAGDHKFVFYDKDNSGGSDDQMFCFWIHTSFVHDDYVCLRRDELDGATGAKLGFFDQDFRCELFFFPDNADVRGLHKALQAHEAKMHQ